MATNDQAHDKMDEQKATSLQDSLSFPSFPKLPTELRLQIWNHALDASPERLISVAIWTLEYLSCHACESTDCYPYRNSPCKTSDMLHPSACVADGYFSDPRHDINDFNAPTNELLQSVSLVCHEARGVVLFRYPETMRVYQKKWNGSKTPYRIVRCNPVQDTLLLVNLPYHYDQHPGFANHHGMWEDCFPKDARQFASFRKIISSFQHVAFNYIGEAGRHSRGSCMVPLRDVEVVLCIEFIIFLFHFESMKTLHLRPMPRYWPEVYKDMIKVEDIQTIQDPPDRELRDVATGIMDGYKEYTAKENYYFECEEHWVPRPKTLEKIGCYAKADWIAK